MGILLGILSALVWGVAGVAGSLGSRRIGARRLIAWGLIMGMALAVPLALLSGAPGPIDARTGLWLLLVAATMVSGMGFVYLGVQRGSISVVAPISALYGGVSALIAILGGEPLTALAIGSLAVAVIGGAFAASGSSSDPRGANLQQGAAAGFAALAALVWGVQLWASSQIQAELGPSWLVLLARSVGLVIIVAPVLAQRRLSIPRRALPYAIAAGCGEVAGFTLYLLSSTYGVAQASVLTGQYGTVAALIGLTVLGERLRGIQYVGLAMIIVAVVGLTLS